MSAKVIHTPMNTRPDPTPLPSTPLAALPADAVRLVHLGGIVSSAGGLAAVPAGKQKAGAVRAAAGVSPDS